MRGRPGQDQGLENAALDLILRVGGARARPIVKGRRQRSAAVESLERCCLAGRRRDLAFASGAGLRPHHIK